MLDRGLWVVHVAASRHPQVLRTLAHTMQVIQNLGVGQVLLTLDEGGGVPSLSFPDLAVEVRPVHSSGLSILGKILVLRSEFSALVQERAPYAIHLHGLAPCILGSRALTGTMLRGRVLYSPHLMPVAWHWFAAPLSRLLRSQLPTLDYMGVAASLIEAQSLSKLLNRSAEVLPDPVSDIFFAVPRQEEARPRILADGLGIEAVDLVVRLCVLLNGRDARVRFSWLGRATPGERAKLDAANVEVLGLTSDADRALAFSRASLFMHATCSDHVARAPAQAMAAGVPCLVSDTPWHRALIRHGETGFVCTSERDFAEKVVLLMRERVGGIGIGVAARADARRRFTWRQFEEAVLRAYGFSTRKASHAAAGNVSVARANEH
jgi:glycosyltransferase involved in cell wall biosynthesis